MKHNEIRRSIVYVVGRVVNDVHYPVVDIGGTDYRFAPKTSASAFPVVDLATDGDVTVTGGKGIYSVVHSPSGSRAELEIDECSHTFRGQYASSAGEFSGKVEGLTVSFSDDELGETITAVLS